MEGQSLAQIAVAQGKTSDGLVAAVVAAAKTQLDVAVAAGKLDSPKEQTLLTKLRTSLATLVTKNLPPAAQAGTSRPRPVTMFLQPCSPICKLHLLRCRTTAGPGPESLRGTGNSRASRTTAPRSTTIVGRVKLKLDAVRRRGRLTPAQAAAFLAKLQAAHAALTGSH